MECKWIQQFIKMQLQRINTHLETILEKHKNNELSLEESIESILNIFGYSNKSCGCVKKKTTVGEHVENKCNQCKGTIFFNNEKQKLND